MIREEAVKRIKRILEERNEECNDDSEIALCCVTHYDAYALDMAIKAIYQVAKLRELRKNLAEKEQVYANQPHDNTLYSNGLADAYCTVNVLIDEILEVE